MKTATTAAALKRLPTFTTDRDGDPIAIIPLANGGAATLDTDAWEDWILAGRSPHWTLNPNSQGLGYVRTMGTDNLVMVSRVLMGAGPGEQVRYRTGDRTDLRRKNLYVTGGGRAKRPASA